MSKARQLELKVSVAAILVSIGDANLAQDELVEAEKNYRESLAIRSALGQRGDIASSELALANLKLELNQANDADTLARNAEEFQAEKMGDQEALARIVYAEALLIQKRISESGIQLEQAMETFNPGQDRNAGLGNCVGSIRKFQGEIG